MSDLGAERRHDSLSRWTARTASVLTGFPSWSAEVRCLDLTEEVGELARAVLVAEGRKSTDLEEPVAQALFWGAVRHRTSADQEGNAVMTDAVRAVH